MKKVEIDKTPDQLLHIQNGYKIAAITWCIEAILKESGWYYNHLNPKEKEKVQKEIDKIVDSLMNKRRKLHKI